MSRVIEIANDEAMPPHTAGEELIVIDFYATWCGPCVQLAPAFAELSNKYPQVKFLKVDVDKCRGLQQAFSVTAMPTVAFLQNKQVLGKFSGGDPRRIEDTLLQLLAGGGQNQQDANDSKVPGQIVLTQFIDKKKLECLNQKNDRGVENVFDEGSQLFLESDCDEQLIINVGFMQPVKIHSLCFSSNVTEEIAPDSSAPKTIKIFVNRNSTLDFDDAESTEAVQEIELTAADVASGKPVELRFVKFQNVTSLILFVKDNQGDTETTAFSNLEIFGGTRESTDMADFKRVAGKKGEGE